MVALRGTCKASSKGDCLAIKGRDPGDTETAPAGCPQSHSQAHFTSITCPVLALPGQEAPWWGPLLFCVWSASRHELDGLTTDPAQCISALAARPVAGFRRRFCTELVSTRTPTPRGVPSPPPDPSHLLVWLQKPPAAQAPDLPCGSQSISWRMGRAGQRRYCPTPSKS